METKHTPEQCYESYQDANSVRELAEYICNSGCAAELAEVALEHLTHHGIPADYTPSTFSVVHRAVAAPALAEACRKANLMLQEISRFVPDDAFEAGWGDVNAMRDELEAALAKLETT